MLGDEEVAAYLNGYLSLWHPLLVLRSERPPRIASPYDHEDPKARQIFACPDDPPMYLPDDWQQKVEQVGAVAYHVTDDRDATFENWKAAMTAFLDKLEDDEDEPDESTSTRADGDKESPSPDASENTSATNDETSNHAFETAETGDRRDESESEAETEEAEGQDLPDDNEYRDYGSVYQDDYDDYGYGSSGAETSEPPRVKLERLKQLLDVPVEQLRPFYGLGFGYMHMTALFEAMDHDNLISDGDFWKEMQQAALALLDGNIDECRSHLQSAAEQLMGGREALYPTGVYVIDIFLVEDDCQTILPPPAYDKELPVNLVTSALALDKMSREHREWFEQFRRRGSEGNLEICVGSYREREEPLTPFESQLWNLTKGLELAKQLLGWEVRIYARKHFGAHPQMPILLAAVGLDRAIFLGSEDAAMPTYDNSVVTWSVGDGKQVEAFMRAPHAADSPQLYFHLAYHLHMSISRDQAATIALLHGNRRPPSWYDDWLALTDLAPVFGQWTTLTDYFNESMAGTYGTSVSSEEYHDDYLTARTEDKVEHPIAWFPRHARMRRRIDTLWTLAAMQRGLTGKKDTLQIDSKLSELEDSIEMNPGSVFDPETSKRVNELEEEIGSALAQRLLSRAISQQPGYLLLNPCSFTRRVALELEEVKHPLPVEGPLKACQVNEDGKAKLVVEVPGLGFAWIPRQGSADTPPQPRRIRLADQRHLRNEFFEAEVDSSTGGLRGIWDYRTRMNRIGQQLVFNPGSKMRASEIKVLSDGPALGEVISEGGILDDHDQLLAKFRQRFRVWLGRPVLEMRIEIFPEHEPSGYPWHAYYGARFAWRDERTLLLRGINGTSQITSHTRPDSPDFLEWRMGPYNVVLFTGGLPFQQRTETRMLDVILITEGEKWHTFDLALGLDREYPMQTALGTISPVPLIGVDKGPPHVGSSGWLFHLDATNLLLTSMRPAENGADSIYVRTVECAAHPGSAEFRCVRNPKRATLVNARGEEIGEAHVYDDAAVFEAGASEFVQLRVDFSA